MKRTRCLLAVAALLLAAACNKGPWATRAESSTEPGLAPLSMAARAKSQPTTIPMGTKLRVALIDGVSSDRSRAGDAFLANLTEPVVIDGRTVLAKGTTVRGHVVAARESGRVKGRASLQLKLTEIVRENGRPIDVSTKPYTAVAEEAKKPVTVSLEDDDECATPGPGRKDVRFQPQHLLSFSLAVPIEI
jgi:hypothetical protein